MCVGGVWLGGRSRVLCVGAVLSPPGSEVGPWAYTHPNCRNRRTQPVDLNPGRLISNRRIVKPVISFAEFAVLTASMMVNDVTPVMIRMMAITTTISTKVKPLFVFISSPPLRGTTYSTFPCDTYCITIYHNFTSM